MLKKIGLLIAHMYIVPFVALAQSTVTTTGGTSGSVPVFTGSATVGTSAITQSGSNVGIGATSPAVPLDVAGFMHVSGDTNPSTAAQGAYLGWNALTGGTGETDFMNNQGGGTGGFAFMNTPEGGSPRTTLMFLSGGGNLGIGTTSPGERFEVSGNLKISGSGSHIHFVDGTDQSTAWTGTLTGGDYAESVDVTGDREQYEPGDVLVVDADHPGHFLKATERYSMAVTGVYSTKPGVVGRRQKIAKALTTSEVPMAMVGIVPTKVTTENGPIKPGDVLVTSSRPGYAMKGTDRSLLAGAVIGKALGRLDSDTGVIEAVISLQ